MWSYGRLASIDGNTFSYDVLGRRVCKNDIAFTYDGSGNLIRQSNGLEFLYDHTGVFAVKYSGSTYFYRKNVQGDVIALLDSAGTAVVQYRYDAWGNCKVLNTSGLEIADDTHIGILNPFRYRSYYYDHGIGLYFLKTRYYDPETGRFLTPDSVEYLDPETIGGLNLYAYCNNNPVMNVDSHGHAWWNWALSGFALAGGIALCFVPGAQALGVSLIVGGATGLLSNTLSAAGVNGKTASIIMNTADIVGGAVLLATPFAGMGASMIGAGVGGLAGGFLSEALGGSFETGSTIGNLAGGVLGGKIYANAKISQLSRRGAVVLGEGMDRVRTVATRTGAAVYDGMPGFQTFSKIIPKRLMAQLGLSHNATWIKWVVKSGVDIIDIGVAGRNSPNYLMEILHIGKYLF